MKKEFVTPQIVELGTLTQIVLGSPVGGPLVDPANMHASNGAAGS